MPAPAPAAAERAPRRARYLIPRDTPRRGEIFAAMGVAALLAHLLFAQLTLVLAVALYAVGTVSRWRPQWLAGPAFAGLVWALAIGPAAAVAGFMAGPRLVAAYLSGIAGEPGRLLHMAPAFAGLGHWLPGQLPLALILAAAEVAAARWLSWLHADARAIAPARPGLIAAARRRYATATVRSGGVVTRDGACLGVDQAGGGLAAVSWREAEGGVLAAGTAAPGLAARGQAGPGPAGPGPAARGPAARGQAARGQAGPGPAGSGPAETGFQLVHAAIRRRKPVIAVDLTGRRWLPGSLAAVCDAAGAPFYQFGEAGQACYEPLRGGDPARAASLVLGMIDWSEATGQRRRTCAAYLGDLFAVLAVAPGDPRQPVLDDVVRLLSPAALRERLGRLPGHHPQRSVLADRAAASASLIEADPGALPALAGQLAALRASGIGRWLCPGGGRLSLGQVLRERAVGLFALDQGAHGPSASMIAGLVAFDAMALFAELSAIGVGGDGVAWFNGCESLDQRGLAELIARGGRAGMTVLLSTTSEPAAASLARDVNVLAIHQVTDPAAAGQLAAAVGPGPAQAAPGTAAVPPGPAEPLVPPVVTGSPVPHARPAPNGSGPAARAVPAWAQRMPVPAAAGASAAGTVAAVPGPGGNHPFSTIGSPAVQADSLQGLRAGAFALFVKGPERRVLPRCQAVPAQIPGRPA